jgi:hypothetical protein
VAVARAACLYCGGPLPPAEAPAAEPPGAATRSEGAGATGSERGLVVLDLASAPPETLASALPLAPYEARLLARRGGFLLHRALALEEARTEVERLAARGIGAFAVPEAEARSRPLRCLGGEREAGVVSLRTEEGPVAVSRGDVLLVVRGPILREYQPTPKRRRVDTARLEEGYRVHLHLRARSGEPPDPKARGVPRPLEIDATSFAFGFAVTGSARLEVDAWAEDLAGGAPIDEGFRRLPPALGPAEPEVKGALAAASSLGLASRGRGDGRDDGPVVLDNSEQFRFYSGWRAAVERRRH